MKDNNILSTESYVISFRYITIYHLVFGYINVYSWMSVHTTYPSLYHDIMSAHEINTRLIIVEGLLHKQNYGESVILSLIHI